MNSSWNSCDPQHFQLIQIFSEQHNLKYIIIWQSHSPSPCVMALILPEDPNSLEYLICPNSSEQNNSAHFMDFSPVQRYTVFSRHIIWFVILITITCAAYFTLLIRDFVILTFNWQWKGWAVVVQRFLFRVSGSCPSWQGSDSSVNADETSKGWGQVNWNLHRGQAPFVQVRLTWRSKSTRNRVVWTAPQKVRVAWDIRIYLLFLTEWTSKLHNSLYISTAINKFNRSISRILWPYTSKKWLKNVITNKYYMHSEKKS